MERGATTREGEVEPKGARRARTALSGRLALMVSAGVLLLTASANAHAGDVEPRADAAAARHTYLTASTPAAGSVVQGPVEEIRLAFSTPVQRALSTASVVAADGSTVPSGGVVPVPDGGENEFRILLRATLRPGAYTVQWRTAGPDDHPVQGSFGFEVGPGAPPGQLDIAEEEAHGVDTVGPTDHAEHAPAVGTGQQPPTPTGPDARLGLAIRWLFHLVIVGMVGTVVFRAGVVRPLSRTPELHEVGVRALQRTRNLAWVAAAAGLMVLPARLLLQTSSIFGSLRPDRLATVVVETAWGTAWLLQVFFTLLFLAGLLATGRGGGRARGWSAMAIGALGMAGIPALSGHAWAAEEQRALALFSTWAHVLAAGIWMGGLGTLLLAGLPSLRRGSFAGLSGMVNAFSRMAVLAVALLITSGVVTAWVHLDALADLWTSDYGRALAVKVGAAFGAFALGFYNWRVVRPALREREAPGMLRIPAAIEFSIGILVLVATAVLVSRGLP